MDPLPAHSTLLTSLNTFFAILLISQDLMDILIRTLIRAELDQCHVALRKLSSSRLYKIYKKRILSSSSSDHNSKSPLIIQRNLDVREFRLDAISMAVEELLNRVRRLTVQSSPTSTRYRDIDRSSEEEADYDDSDGWADPDPAESQIPNEADVGSGLAEIDEDVGVRNPDSMPFDPHPYARRKRKLKVDRLHQKRGPSRRNTLDQISIQN